MIHFLLWSIMLARVDFYWRPMAQWDRYGVWLDACGLYISVVRR
jgi:hypothetical protein